MYEWIQQLDQITMDLPTDMLIIAPPHERSKDPIIMKIVNNQIFQRNVSCEAPNQKSN